MPASTVTFSLSQSETSSFSSSLESTRPGMCASWPSSNKSAGDRGDATHLHGEASTSVIVLRRDWSSQEHRTRMKATRSKKPSPRFQLSRQPLKQRQHSRSSRSERGRIPDPSTCSGRAAIAVHRSWTSPCSLAGLGTGCDTWHAKDPQQNMLWGQRLCQLA